jgi:hypothetical protein
VINQTQNKELLQQSLSNTFTKKARGLCFIFIFISLLIQISGNNLYAQDTVKPAPKPLPLSPKEMHSPHKATIYAMVLPGLGQAYNHKYWKIPVVYVGFGACIYFIKFNSGYYKDFKDAYNYETITKRIVYPATPPYTFYPLPDPPNDVARKNYTESQLKEGRDYYRRNLEISYIATGVWYILTVVDAVVDAHFYDYNINDDLTLQIKPWVPTIGTNAAFGFSGGVNLTMRF